MKHNQGIVINPETGKPMFAYNGVNGDPYHRLGTAVDGYGTIDEMLAASGCDYEVRMLPLAAYNDEDGDLIDVPDSYATVTTRRVYDSDEGIYVDKTDVLGVVGKGYTVEQNREAAQFAYDCVGASGGDAIIDTMGAMKDLTQFFVYLRLDPLVLDPSGIADTINMGLAVLTSHDGSISLCAYPTATRLVCSNTVTMTLSAGRRNGSVVKVRHTKNKQDYKVEAVKVLGIAEKLRDDFVKQAEYMIHLPANFDSVRNVAAQLWPLEDDPSKRALTIHETRLLTLEATWHNTRNASQYGENAWVAWQTIIEYLDHHRGLTPDKRAAASIDMDSSINDMKRRACALLVK